MSDMKEKFDALFGSKKARPSGGVSLTLEEIATAPDLSEAKKLMKAKLDAIIAGAIGPNVDHINAQMTRVVKEFMPKDPDAVMTIMTCMTVTQLLMAYDSEKFDKYLKAALAGVYASLLGGAAEGIKVAEKILDISPDLSKLTSSKAA